MERLLDDTQTKCVCSVPQAGSAKGLAPVRTACLVVRGRPCMAMESGHMCCWKGDVGHLDADMCT